ncbi:PAS domain S-box-containing protein/putative nucleotidyltransferase with HDIG domain [Desulfobaculum xiamenense]|uniref:PAS domain S-box-containing protein/putative nucleotidyltransferase with HDIG domain n=1 Tax=Desulfobaculum xiamenense TaxID=995050 RepID=A0A846QW79_9BACT|nr:HD domain-containing phosphohydrolase [Desulfobaculum xiamenense]NJB69364.1 PAS domain S-box-containing protein/putative nucleotidyltransferase with HDIG domain [Desulfobaculum xiamenense]
MTKKRILVVEDESIVSLDIRHRLKALGYEAAALVSSGEDAVRMAGESAPDLVLMDIHLAGAMDGVQAAEEIRHRFDVPVVYLTAYADHETLQRVKVTEPFGYILKPFEDRELQSAIEMACYKHRSERRVRDNARWLESTLESVGEGVISADGQGRVKYMNGAAAALTGWALNEAAGRGLSDLLALGGADGDEPVDLVGAVLASGEAVRTDALSLKRRSGGEVPVEISVTAVRGERGDILGVVVALRDITERRQAVSALRRSVSELRQARDATVGALIVTSEKRDPYTAGHQARVSRLAVAMARRLDLPAEVVEGIEVAAKLHDLGKIYIPAEILSKPALLSDIEQRMVQAHPSVGYDILRGVPFPWPVADIVHQHHERLDGSGYPRGLAGEAILPQARVLAVADVVEAMSSHRPYRASLGLPSALDEIRAGRGGLYDATVVDACLALFDSGYDFEEAEGEYASANHKEHDG